MKATLTLSRLCRNHCDFVQVVRILFSCEIIVASISGVDVLGFIDVLGVVNVFGVVGVFNRWLPTCERKTARARIKVFS